jgi:hypothetical protein
MNTRTAIQYGALAGMVIGGLFVAITPEPTLAKVLATMCLAVCVPVFVIQLAGSK